ncbi:hypothetical protein GOA58_21215 [Sinorhizobium meliloti]|nr:hypothetical protein [Sinorhizobium meliloti]MDW9663133.1 hypothetical protein [Sinorhizobium meliloti]MDX0052716.1 hypothetical protein [Sinorhizobium meliloti]
MGQDRANDQDPARAAPARHLVCLYHNRDWDMTLGQHTKRRTFLTGSAAVAATSILGAALPVRAAAHNRPAARRSDAQSRNRAR